MPTRKTDRPTFIMQLRPFDDLLLDSRRAIYLPFQGTLVLPDFFLGLGSARRRRPDAMPLSQQQEIWERLIGLLNDYQPGRVVILGDIKPSQATLEGDEAEELALLFRKLKGRDREVIQVAGHPERVAGPVTAAAGVPVMESLRVGLYTLIHRRRIFVYPRHDPPQGFWINGGLHPLFAVPTPGPAGGEEWLRYPAFLYTGFALVMPPFVPYAQGWEVMQPERLPRQARAWRLMGSQLLPLALPELPPPPETLRFLNRSHGKARPKSVSEDSEDQG